LNFRFQIEVRSGRARAGHLSTPHGDVETPAFMPVGTQAVVKATTCRDLVELGAEIILANTYHLMLRPGAELVEKLGGLHGFTGWTRPFLTDSGGFQVFSLAGRRRVEEQGVRFKSHLDGSAQLLTPERSIDVQSRLGADLIMAFDECPPYTASRDEVAAATARTRRWAERCRDAHRRDDQWLLGIVQGGVDPELREQSARDLMALDFPGYAIGGLSVGEPKPERDRVLESLDPVLPEDRPRYLMGVGTPADVVEGVARGVDLFDCVLPTRNARNGQLFTSQGRLAIRNRRYREDPRPPDPGCACLTCRSVSRAYLRHLFVAGEITAAVLMTRHNLAFYLDTLRRVRETIRSGRFEELRREVTQGSAGPVRADPRDGDPSGT
jgi:queuine tRNA-ribosyltransferase